MKNQILIDVKKYICIIDNDQRIIRYYDLLSLYEKLEGKDIITELKFDDIQVMTIDYSIIDGLKKGTGSITLSITCTNHSSYDFSLLFRKNKRKDFNSFFQLLSCSQININDPYHIVDKILNSTNSIGTILSKIKR